MELLRFDYKGYFTLAEFSPEDDLYCGKLEGISDFVNFMGETPEKAEAAFREAVDDYLDFCKEVGKQPCRP